MTRTAVDPAILSVVGKIGRPERCYDALHDTRHTLLRQARFQFARPFPARHEFNSLGSVPGDVELIAEAV